MMCLLHSRVVSSVIEMTDDDWTPEPEPEVGVKRLIWTRPAGSGKVIEPYFWAADLNF